MGKQEQFLHPAVIRHDQTCPEQQAEGTDCQSSPMFALDYAKPESEECAVNVL